MYVTIFFKKITDTKGRSKEDGGDLDVVNVKLVNKSDEGVRYVGPSRRCSVDPGTRPRFPSFCSGDAHNSIVSLIPVFNWKSPDCLNRNYFSCNHPCL